jgi:hypothetical protein
MGSTIDIAIAMSIVDVEVNPMGSFSTLPVEVKFVRQISYPPADGVSLSSNFLL